MKKVSNLMEKIDLTTIVDELRKQECFVDDVQLVNGVLSFTTVADCMHPFEIEVHRSTDCIVARLSVTFYEFRDVRSVIRSILPDVGLYKSIRYIQNGDEIYRNRLGSFMIFDELSENQHIEIIVEIEEKDEEEYCRVVSDLVIKMSLAFINKSFMDTAEIAKDVRKIWGENRLYNVNWNGYTLKPIRADLPLMNFEMLLLCNNTLVIRIEGKNDNDLLLEISEKIIRLDYFQHFSINESYTEFMISNYNLSADSDKMRNIVAVVNDAIEDISKPDQTNNVNKNCSLICEEKEFKFKVKDKDGKIHNCQALLKIQADETDYLIYADDSWKAGDELEIHIGYFISDSEFIDLHPVKTKQKWEKLKSTFNEIIEERVHALYLNKL